MCTSKITHGHELNNAGPLDKHALPKAKESMAKRMILCGQKTNNALPQAK